MSEGSEIFLLNSNIVQKIIKEIISKIMEFYIFPEKAEQISKFFSNKLNNGDYNQIGDPIMFQQEITTDLQEISTDYHFYFEFNPRLASELKQRDYEQQDGDEDFIDDHELKLGLYDNYHIVKAERLPGNIGYIKINDFQPAEYAGDVIIGALQFLANCYALIFDVRNNGGGYPSMVQLITSYLIGPSSKLLNTFYYRNKDKYSESYTLPYVPGKRSFEKPVYILTSSRTASAAEEFAYNLKMMKRANIVGEATRGAANPIENFPIFGKFVISLPIGRPINPISNDNWEGKGVTPHHQSRQEDALKEAHLLTLKEVLKSCSDNELKKFLKFELEYCEALYNGVNIDKSIIKKYLGEYQGANLLFIDNQLIFERKNLKYPLITKDNHNFYANERMKIWFGEENQQKSLYLHQRVFDQIIKLNKS